MAQKTKPLMLTKEKQIEIVSCSDQLATGMSTCAMEYTGF